MKYDVQLFYSHLSCVEADSREEAIDKARARMSALESILDYDVADTWEVDE